MFLREQIESLLKQNNEDITILVRDDGSSDKTVGILEEYEKEVSCKHILEEI